MKRRSFTSQWCSMHAKRAAKYGHPLAQHIQKSDLKPYRRRARKLLRRFASHPATVTALEIMEGLLHPGPAIKPNRTDDRYYLYRELADLSSADPPVAPQEALEVTIAVHLMAYYEPRRFPDDGEPLNCAVSNALFRLRQRPITESHYDPATGTVENIGRPISGRACSAFGRRVRLSLGRYLLNIRTLIEVEERQRQEKARALAMPLTVQSATCDVTP
jgi:hypothetical protein